MPEIIFETLDKVPEGLRDIAKEVEGGVSINVVAKSKLDEFRENNITLSTERDQLKERVAKFEPIIGENPEDFVSELEALRQTAQQVADGKLKASGDIEREVANRVASMKEDYTRQLQNAANETSAWKNKAGESDKRYRNSLIERAVTDAVLNPESGVEARALPDIISRATKIFVVDEHDAVIPKDGEATIYGSDGATPMTMNEWVEGLKDKAPYFFKNSSGGGAAGGDKTLPGNYTQEEWNKLPARKKLELANRK